jgi:hypothetical protein
MSHDDDTPSKDDWSPDKEDADAKRLDRLMDLAEKQLAGLGREAARRPDPAPELAVGVGAPARSQIELRMIENGFLMTYFRAARQNTQGLGFEVYSPVPVEVFVSGPEDAAVEIGKAMKAAALLSKSSKDYLAYCEGRARGITEAPPAVLENPDRPIPDL